MVFIGTDMCQTDSVSIFDVLMPFLEIRNGAVSLFSHLTLHNKPHVGFHRHPRWLSIQQEMWKMTHSLFEAICTLMCGILGMCGVDGQRILMLGKLCRTDPARRSMTMILPSTGREAHSSTPPQPSKRPTACVREKLQGLDGRLTRTGPWSVCEARRETTLKSCHQSAYSTWTSTNLKNMRTRGVRQL